MSTSRQLAAILFADIQGYTALMQKDEFRALTLREKFQKILEQEIKLQGGRVAVYSGDGALCVFKSAAGAVNAAISIQHKMIEDPAVPLRIGIHTGDVITEGKNVFGDGVNIASRIESFAVPGSVFISGKVADEIKNQQHIALVSLGSFELKNVTTPIEIFAIQDEKLIVPNRSALTGKGKRGSRQKGKQKAILLSLAALLVLGAAGFLFFKNKPSSALSSPEARTIAVLPFANLSAQKEDEYFADGMCDQILTNLSKISALNVLSRTSTLQFRDTKKTMKEISQLIGADVLLEGSVQKSGDQIRINVQLIDAMHEKHLWAETYDRQLKDIFSVQSDIAGQIAEALNTTLTSTEQLVFSEKPTDNMEAFDLYLRANKASAEFWSFSRMDKVPEAINLYEKAISLDPRFLEAYSDLIALYTEISFRKPVTNAEDYRLKAKEWLDKMLSLKIDKPVVHATIAIYKYEGERDYPGALAEMDLVDQYFHNDKQTVGMRGYVLRRMGRLEEALRYFLREAHAYPKSVFAQSDVADTYSPLRNPDSAIYFINKCIQLRPDRAGLYADKASIYATFKGDLEMSKRILRDASSFVDTGEFRDSYIFLDMLEGDYKSAISRLTNKKDSIYVLNQGAIKPNALLIAIMLLNQGDKSGAKLYFEKSKDILEKLVSKSSNDFRVYEALGVVYAGLGDRNNALEAGIKARKLMPISVDAIVGIYPLENLALIHVLLGEQNEAIDILEQLLKMPYAWEATNTKALYKTHPYWKLLQKNPRFIQMVQ